jgi:hypothetical protein
MLMAEAFEYGAMEYGIDDWITYPGSWREYAAAILRHTFKWLKRERYDKKSHIHHLAHAAATCLILLEWETTGVGNDDRPKYKERGRVDLSRM